MTGLARRVDERDVKVAVVGLGYVGVPLSIEFTEAGFEVRGYDIDEARVEALRRADSYVEDIQDDRITGALEAGFKPSTNSDVIGSCEVVVFAVPTQMGKDTPDMSALSKAVETAALERAGKGRTLYVVGSTVYPGAVDDVVVPALAAGGANANEILVSVVPERLSPGSGRDIGDLPVVVGADRTPAEDASSALFDTIAADVHPVESTKIAAASKLLENTYRLVNISMINEFAIFAEGEGIDVWKTIEAAATKPFGFQPFYPGAGAGGHCTPVDPRFLAWRARELGCQLETIETATEINRSMPTVVFESFERWLAEEGVDIETTRIHAIGLTYKPDIADLRNSPAVGVCEQIATRADQVTALDPYVDGANLELPRDVTHVKSPEEADPHPDDVAVLLVDQSELDIETIVNTVSHTFDVTNSLDHDRDNVRVFAGGGRAELRLDGHQMHSSLQGTR